MASVAQAQSTANEEQVRMAIEQAMIAQGNKGLASGKGFYDWTGCDAASVRAQASGRLNALLDFLKKTVTGDRPGTKPKGRDIRRRP